MSIESKVEGQDDIVYVDLTQYDGPWPPPRNYGLTAEQDEKLKSMRRWPRLRGKYTWFIPFLVFLIPDDIYSLLPPLGWLMHLESYIFPVMRVAKHVYANGDKVQLVFGITLIATFLYMPYNMRLLYRALRRRLNMSRCSVILISARASGNSPKTLRQTLLWIGPIVLIVLFYYIFCDAFGYVAHYGFGVPLLVMARWNLGIGGLISGAGWLSGAIHSYVTSGRSQGLAASDVGILMQAYLLRVSLVVEVFMLLYLRVFHVTGGILRWRRQLIEEERYLTALLKLRKSSKKNGSSPD
jgi:hypothetical protein